MAPPPTVIVAGYFVRYPAGGHVLSILHYLKGLIDLGYEVVFVEEYGWPGSCYDPTADAMGDDPSYGIAELRRNLGAVGVHAWCYVDARGEYHGLSAEQLRQRCRQAALLLSLWQVTWLDEFEDCRKRVFVDLDPGFTQFDMDDKPARSERGYASPHDFHHHFTYGVRIGSPDCPIPTHGLRWRPTRPPVALDLLPARFTPDAALFTTVMSWNARAPIVYGGIEYGQKDVEFRRVIGLPTVVGPIFEIALGGPNPPRDEIMAAGWKLADPRVVAGTPWAYRDYVAGSRGEFSVAVNLEVRTRSGWFSDRTAAYLACGKPAIVQDTGFSELLPCGAGLLPFRTFQDAVAAIADVQADYRSHCHAARKLAERYFDAQVVLAALLQQCEVPEPVATP